MRFVFGLAFLFCSSCFSRKLVYLVTCGPGEELYSTFGHSAIWVHDTLNNVDQVFNYGTFDFETEGFYVKFTRGKLPYALDYTDLNTFVNSYVYENREIKLQRLSIDSSKAEALHQFLTENMKEENRYYAYDFFFDNCSTRLRDLLERTLGSTLVWDTTSNKENLTLRQLLNPGVEHMPWTKFGFYLGLGAVTDKIATSRQMLFLPNHLFDAVGLAKIGNSNLTLATTTLFRPETTKKDSATIFTPFIFSTIFIAFYLSSWLMFKNKKLTLSLENFTLLIVSLLGLLLIFLWFGTDHQATKMNFNVLWASPTLFCLVVLKNRSLKKIVFATTAASALLFFLVALLRWQEFHLVAYILSVFTFLISAKRTFGQIVKKNVPNQK